MIMAVHSAGTPSADRTIAAGSVSAGPVPAQHSRTDVAARVANRCAPEPTPTGREGIHAAASVMGWVLWLLLAFITAAFLTFAPRML